MSILDTLVTDRSQEDVIAMNRKALYLAEDLNRVESTVSFLADILTGIGFSLNLETKTDWDMNDLPAFGEMDRYLENIRAIRGALSVSDDTPEVPEDMDKLTYQEANDIEKILLNVGETAARISSTYLHCGETDCGWEGELV